MNEPPDSNRTVDVPSTPAASLDAGQAAGFGPPTACRGTVGTVTKPERRKPKAIRSDRHRSTYSNRMATDVLPAAPTFGSKRFSPGNPIERVTNTLITVVNTPGRESAFASGWLPRLLQPAGAAAEVFPEADRQRLAPVDSSSWRMAGPVTYLLVP
jgi:hypothetical protein